MPNLKEAIASSWVSAKCFYALWICKRNMNYTNDKKDGGVIERALKYVFRRRILFASETRDKTTCICVCVKSAASARITISREPSNLSTTRARASRCDDLECESSREADIYIYNKCEEWNNLHFLSSSRPRKRAAVDFAQLAPLLIYWFARVLNWRRQNRWFRDWISGCSERDETRAKNVGMTTTWESCLKWIRTTSLLSDAIWSMITPCFAMSAQLYCQLLTHSMENGFRQAEMRAASLFLRLLRESN